MTPAHRRAFVVVIDACGVGALPDAASYGDEGTNTLAHVAEAVGGLRLPVLAGLGLGNVTPLRGVAPRPDAPAIWGRLHALGPGKDSTAGHWELMGVIARVAPPTYPQGLDAALLRRLEEATGHALICNRPYNGVAAIERYGAEHLRSGGLILYTSVDSVVQLAAHADRVAPAELYRACEAVRAAMTGADAVGRVIARPFEGGPGEFRRTAGRRDYALPPPARSYLDAVRDAGVAVQGVGKVGDLFTGRGFDQVHPAPTNAIALDRVGALLEQRDNRCLVFANLIETDQRYGHRKDTEGFHRALREIDDAVGEWLPRLGREDLLVITADHGVDPASAATDHTREHAPLLAVSPSTGGGRHDGPLSDVGSSALRWLTGQDAPELPGEAFV
jgi:phosphopentomutase